MSDTLRIALVAEGPTDSILIEAALTAILDRDCILTQLQPEATRPYRGQGWSGVLKWCCDAGRRHCGSLSDDPTLAGFDVLIVHLDVDVAAMNYQACGAGIAELADRCKWMPLPCSRPCPPADDSAQALSGVMRSWLGGGLSWGERTVLCLPAQSSGTWLAAAVLTPCHRLLRNAECDAALENQLSRLPKAQRIRKSQREYRAHANSIIQNWSVVKDLCGQAVVFEQEVQKSLA